MVAWIEASAEAGHPKDALGEPSGEIHMCWVEEKVLDNKKELGKGKREGGR